MCVYTCVFLLKVKILEKGGTAEHEHGRHRLARKIEVVKISNLYVHLQSTQMAKKLAKKKGYPKCRCFTIRNETAIINRERISS